MSVTDVVDTDRYPLADPGGDAWRAVVAQTRRELSEVGCSVLSGFIRADCFDALCDEGARAAPDAYYQVEIVNVYNTDPDPGLPADHPGHVTMERGNAFVPRDRIEPAAIIHRLYTSPEFQRFVADCFELDQLYELADPLSGLVLNVIRPGRQHPWHFDTNEFTVSLLTSAPSDGGVFEYCPNIRTAQDERFDDVPRCCRAGASGSSANSCSVRATCSCSKAGTRCIGCPQCTVTWPATPPSSRTASARASSAAPRARASSSAGCSPSTSPRRDGSGSTSSWTRRLAFGSARAVS